VLLTLHELAGGGEAIVSRGELIEIGDGFASPTSWPHRAAELREVGTTIAPHLDDYPPPSARRTPF